MSQKIPQTLEVPLSSLVELAIECWRLERRLNNPTGDHSISHARHAARRLNKFLEERELSVLDLAGRGHEPGLALDVLDVIEDESLPQGTEIIEEMVAPIVLWRGAVVRYGQAIIKRGK
ncbi:MAG: hypothetical protein LC754_06295 [Acidobacteria bacterium]|nr:hypothetical protein [Acidobacteriota bacterium]